MLEMIICGLFIFFLSLNQSCSFFIQLGKDGDMISAKEDYCSGLAFCQCNSSTLLGYDSSIICGNEVTGCNLRVEGSSFGIYTASGMSSYKLILTTGTSTAVCVSEPTPAPIFIHDYQTKMFWNVYYSTLLQQRFLASIKDSNKVELEIAHHMQGLFLKVFINCDNKQQCIAIKFDGLQEYPLSPDVVTNDIGLPFPSPPPTTTTTATTTTTSTSPTTASTTTTSPSTTLPTTTTPTTTTPTTTTITATTITSTKSTTTTPTTTTILTTPIATTPTTTTSTTTESTTTKPTSTLATTTIPTTTTPTTTTPITTSTDEISPAATTLPTSATTTTKMENTSNINITTYTGPTSAFEQNTTNIPPRTDAIKTEKSYLVEIIIGLAAFFLLLVFILVCVLACKRRRRKSLFKVPGTNPALTSVFSDGAQINHASMIRMENNSLSTTPSKMNNLQVKSNPLYAADYEQESLNGLEEMPEDEPIKPEIQESYNNPSFKPDIVDKRHHRRVMFSPPSDRVLTPVEEGSFSDLNSVRDQTSFPLHHSPDLGSTTHLVPSDFEEKISKNLVKNSNETNYNENATFHYNPVELGNTTQYNNPQDQSTLYMKVDKSNTLKNRITYH